MHHLINKYLTKYGSIQQLINMVENLQDENQDQQTKINTLNAFIQSKYPDYPN